MRNKKKKESHQADQLCNVTAILADSDKLVLALSALIALMMEALQTSETSVNLRQSAWRYNPEDSHL
jgi:hypothetical protein